VPHTLPVVLSATEVDEFFQHVCTIRYRAALMTAYGAGLRVSEVVALQVGDIDSKRMLIRVRQGKGKKDRYAMLSLPPAGSAALLVALPAPCRTAAAKPRRKTGSFPAGAKAAT